VTKGTGCPYCSNHKVLVGFNDLASQRPDLLKEWDYIKNKKKPEEVVYTSQLKYYWVCEKGHSYMSSIYNRGNRKTGCSVCLNKEVLVGYNDFESKYPELAKGWDYIRNSVSPDMVAYGSDKKFWWICEHGHEWEAKVCNRVNGRGCPECYKAQKWQRQINMYDADTFAFIATFDSVKAVCDYLGLDSKKANGTISRVCRRKQKTLMKKYVLRNDDDDEFSK
jgi:hypothetical protein